MIQEMFNAADNNNGKSEDNNRGNDFSDNSDVVKVDRQERSDLTDISDSGNFAVQLILHNRCSTSSSNASRMLQQLTKQQLEEWIDNQSSRRNSMCL